MRNLSKILLTLAVAVCCLASTLLLVACGSDDVKISKAYVKAGTLDTTVYVGEQLDTSNVVLVLEYPNKSKREIPAADLVFGDFDTSAVGVFPLTITYREYIAEKISFEKSISVNITVANEADAITVMSMDSELINDYLNNKKAKPENVRTEFKVLNEPIYVGDDNKFNFRINATGYINGTPSMGVRKVRTIITVKLNGQELTGDELAQYVAVDTENTTLDFTEAAIGKTFHVIVKAANIDDSYDDESATRFETDLTVIDGFNVYNARDLSVYDNYHESWNEIKKPHGIYKDDLRNVKPNAIILQDTIYITKNDVPEDFFWNTKTDTSTIDTVKGRTGVDITGTPKDDSDDGIYRRSIAKDENFQFIGNYFSINISGNADKGIAPFPLIKLQGLSANNKVVKDGEMITAHMTLFFTGNPDNDGDISKATKAEYKNISFIGNGRVSNNAENSGGLLMMKNRRVNFNAYNTINQNFGIGYFMLCDSSIADGENNGEYVIEKCKGYGSYQCLIYLWAGKHTVIKDCNFEDCGGPAIIADSLHYENKGKTDGSLYFTSSIDIINSVIKSEVSGGETWFAAYQGAANAVGQIITAEDQLFNDNSGKKAGLLPNSNKSIISSTVGDNVQRINLVVLMKDGSVEGLSTEMNVGGYVRFYDSVEDYENKVNVNGLEFEKKNFGTYNLNDLAKQNGSNIFQNNENGGFINTYIAETLKNGETPSATDGTFVIGQTKAYIMSQVMKNVLSSMSITIDQDLREMNLTSGVNYLLNKINGISLPTAALEAIISNADDQFKNYRISDGFAIANFDTLTTEEQNAAFRQAIQAFETDYTYAAGDYINLYIGAFGIGAVIGLYNR